MHVKSKNAKKFPCNKKLNIAMVGHKRIPSREGGVEIVVKELSTRLVARGNNVTVYNRREHNVIGNDLKSYKGVHICTVPTIERKGMAAVTSSFFATIKALFGHYDCIHYHAEGPSVMLFIPHLFGIRTVVTIHGLDWQRSKWGGFASWYLRQGEKIAAKYADEVIVLSANVQKYFNDTYHRETVFIPNGIEKPKRKATDNIKKKWGLNNSDYILYLGRIVPEKGLKYLINAFKQVKTEKKLVIAGGSSDTDEFMMELLESAKSDNRIIFTGFVQGQALEELYSNAYIYTLPSDLEGMPISLLEAMSYGNCCLTSDIPECTEVCKDKSVTFKKSNVGDLVRVLQDLCNHPEIVQKYRYQACDFICNKYNWDNVVDKTLLLYQKQEEVKNENINGQQVSVPERRVGNLHL